MADRDREAIVSIARLQAGMDERSRRCGPAAQPDGSYQCRSWIQSRRLLEVGERSAIVSPLLRWLRVALLPVPSGLFNRVTLAASCEFLIGVRGAIVVFLIRLGLAGWRSPRHLVSPLLALGARPQTVLP